MKSFIKLILITVLLTGAVTGALLSAQAEVPHLINYQGKLTDSDGKALDGSYSITFRIYDAENKNEGELLWTETQNVVIDRGVFSVMLGSTKDLNIPFDKPYFLEFKVGDEVMSPRQRIASVGYAFKAENADTASIAVNADNAEMIKGKAVDTPAADDDGKVLRYDHSNSKFEMAPYTSVKTGTYSGDGSETQVIYHNLGRVPLLILIMADGASPNSHGIWISGNSRIVLFNTSNSFETTVTSNTFTVTASGGGDFNERGRNYRYIVM